jgi:hypothetical protein
MVRGPSDLPPRRGSLIRQAPGVARTSTRQPLDAKLQKLVFELKDSTWTYDFLRIDEARWLGTDAFHLQSIQGSLWKLVEQIATLAREIAIARLPQKADLEALKRLDALIQDRVALLPTVQEALAADLAELATRRGVFRQEPLWSMPPALGGLLDFETLRGLVVARLACDPRQTRYGDLLRQREQRSEEEDEHSQHKQEDQMAAYLGVRPPQPARSTGSQLVHLGLPTQTLDLRLRHQEDEVLKRIIAAARQRRRT